MGIQYHWEGKRIRYRVHDAGGEGRGGGGGGTWT